MNTANTEALAAELDEFDNHNETDQIAYRAADELRRLQAENAELRAERDALRADFARLMEKHNNLHENAARDRAERDALQQARERVLQRAESVEAERDNLSNRLSVAEELAAQYAAKCDLLNAELERERMRLTACGVVALADTPASAAVARDMHPDYRSASCDDVARRVDECISLRAERDALRAERDDLKRALAFTARLVQDWEQSATAIGAERNAFRANSDRYLWLRDTHGEVQEGDANWPSLVQVAWSRHGPRDEKFPDEKKDSEVIDAAIDAAMKGTQ